MEWREKCGRVRGASSGTVRLNPCAIGSLGRASDAAAGLTDPGFAAPYSTDSLTFVSVTRLGFKNVTRASNACPGTTGPIVPGPAHGLVDSGVPEGCAVAVNVTPSAAWMASRIC